MVIVVKRVIMKTPKISMPKEEKDATPVAPMANTSGLMNELNNQRTKQGFLASFLGRDQGGTSGNRLAQYLGAGATSPVKNENSGTIGRFRIPGAPAVGSSKKLGKVVNMGMVRK